MRKNNRGITLIALIVTIIVLIIIAGISIATLTADNGILRQTNSAKVAQIEGTAREQVRLACATMRLAIAEASAKDNSYSAVEHAKAIQEELLGTIKADSTGLDENEDSWTSSTANNGDTEFTVTYAGQDYKNACNDNDAKIVYTIGLSQKTIELKSEENATLKDQNGNNVVLDIGSNEGTGSGSGEGDGEGDDTGDGSGSSGTGTQYLVDVVEIGDYVDLGDSLEYRNQYSFSTGYTTATSGAELTGWRVLSKSGTGANGTVTLVSAGTPLTFYHPSGGYSATLLEYLEDLNKQITLVSGSTQGFVKNGLSSTNLASVWSSNSRINTSDGVHALTTTELETTYATLTRTTKTMSELDVMTHPCKTSNMLTVNPNMSEKANDLLGIGMNYWLGGSSYDASSLWIVGANGNVLGNYIDAGGVRPVLSLNSGVQISSTNTGDGSSVNSAYTLN